MLATIPALARTTLAACPGFWAWAGVGNSAAALPRIYLEGLPLPVEAYTAAALEALRPYAIVWPSETDALRIESDSSIGWRSTGSLEILLSKRSASYGSLSDVASLYAAVAAQIDAIVWTGNPVSPGLLDLASLAGYLATLDLAVDMVGRTPPASVNDYGDAYDVLLRLTWGRRQ